MNDRLKSLSEEASKLAKSIAEFSQRIELLNSKDMDANITANILKNAEVELGRVNAEIKKRLNEN